MPGRPDLGKQVLEKPQATSNEEQSGREYIKLSKKKVFIKLSQPKVALSSRLTVSNKEALGAYLLADFLD